MCVFDALYVHRYLARASIFVGVTKRYDKRVCEKNKYEQKGVWKLRPIVFYWYWGYMSR
jgi:hypothetical protein